MSDANERMIRKIFYLTVGLLFGYAIQNYAYNSMINSGVEPSVAFTLSLGIFAIVLAFWIGTLRVIFKRGD